MASFVPYALPEHCSPTAPFLVKLSVYFGTCIPTPLAAVSTLLGTLSIVSWLFAQLPQIYKNYQLQSTAGLSIFFLVEWCLGDTTNLLGALFTRQAGWQVVVASYYVFVDVCLVFQYFWYMYFKPRLYACSLHSSGSSDRSEASSDIIETLSPINSTFLEGTPMTMARKDGSRSPPSKPIDTPQFSQVKYSQTPTTATETPFEDKSGSSWFVSPSPRTILQFAALSSMVTRSAAASIPFSPLQLFTAVHRVRMETPTEIAGTILSWSSTGLYLGSRLPQLYKNWQRQSTAGLSPLLFLAAFCGNTFYSTSLLTNPNAWNDYSGYGGHGWAGPEGNNRWEWVARAAPFFLGAAGVLGLDASMGVQFLLYSEREEEKLVKVRDGHGHSRWQKVNGWMRGWVPSITGKERVVNLAESQRLLGESRELDRRQSHHNEYGTV